jgi:hypothetical protein
MRMIESSARVVSLDTQTHVMNTAPFLGVRASLQDVFLPPAAPSLTKFRGKAGPL